MTNNTKNTLLCLLLLLLAYFLGILVGVSITQTNTVTPPPTPNPFTLTNKQATLTLSAIELMRDDLPDIKDKQVFMTAFGSLLPSDCKEAVIRALGNPDLDAMPGALEALETKVRQFAITEPPCKGLKPLVKKITGI